MTDPHWIQGYEFYVNAVYDEIPQRRGAPFPLATPPHNFGERLHLAANHAVEWILEDRDSFPVGHRDNDNDNDNANDDGEDSDSDDSHDDSVMRIVAPSVPIHVQLAWAIDFARSLPYYPCLFVNCLSGDTGIRWTYCPCSRVLFNNGTHEKQFQGHLCPTKSYNANAFYQHCRARKDNGCAYHAIIHCFLTCLDTRALPYKPIDIRTRDEDSSAALFARLIRDMSSPHTQDATKVARAYVEDKKQQNRREVEGEYERNNSMLQWLPRIAPTPEYEAVAERKRGGDGQLVKFFRVREQSSVPRDQMARWMQNHRPTLHAFALGLMEINISPTNAWILRMLHDIWIGSRDECPSLHPSRLLLHESNNNVWIREALVNHYERPALAAFGDFQGNPFPSEVICSAHWDRAVSVVSLLGPMHPFEAAIIRELRDEKERYEAQTGRTVDTDMSF